MKMVPGKLFLMDRSQEVNPYHVPIFQKYGNYSPSPIFLSTSAFYKYKRIGITFPDTPSNSIAVFPNLKAKGMSLPAPIAL